MTFIIEKNLPIPQAVRGGQKTGKWTALASSMGLGDSVLLENQREARTLYQALNKLGFGGAQRKVDYPKDGAIYKKYRVWRIK